MSKYFGMNFNIDAGDLVQDTSPVGSLFDYSPFKNNYFSTSIPKYSSYFDEYGVPTEKALGYKLNDEEKEQYFTNTLKAQGKEVPVSSSRSMFRRIVDALGITVYPIQGALKYATDKSPRTKWYQGAWEGIKAANPIGEGNPEGYASFGDVINNLGWKLQNNPKGRFLKPWTWNANNVAHHTADFIGTVLLDPATYASFGIESVLRGTGSSILKNTAKELAKEGFETGMKELTPELAKSLLRNAGQEVTEEAAQSLMKAVGRQAGYIPKNNPISWFGKEFVSSDTMRKIGDNTIAPYVNQALDFIGKMPLGKNKTLGTIFKGASVNATKLARQNPVQYAALLTFKDYASDLSKTFKETQNIFRANAEQIFDGISPETRTLLSDIMEQKGIWKDIKRPMGTYVSKQFTPEAKSMFDDLMNAKDEIAKQINLYNQFKGQELKVQGLEQMDSLLTKILSSPAYDYNEIINQSGISILNGLSTNAKYDVLNQFRNKNVNEIATQLTRQNVPDAIDEAYKIRAVIDNASRSMNGMERPIWMGQKPNVDQVLNMAGLPYTNSLPDSARYSYLLKAERDRVLPGAKEVTINLIEKEKGVKKIATINNPDGTIVHQFVDSTGKVFDVNDNVITKMALDKMSPYIENAVKSKDPELFKRIQTEKNRLEQQNIQNTLNGWDKERVNQYFKRPSGIVQKMTPDDSEGLNQYFQKEQTVDNALAEQRQAEQALLRNNQLNSGDIRLQNNNDIDAALEEKAGRIRQQDYAPNDFEHQNAVDNAAMDLERLKANIDKSAKPNGRSADEILKSQVQYVAKQHGVNPDEVWDWYQKRQINKSSSNPYFNSKEPIDWYGEQGQYFKGKGINDSIQYGNPTTYNEFNNKGVKILEPVNGLQDVKTTMIKTALDKIETAHPNLSKLLQQITFRAEDVNGLYEAVTNIERKKLRARIVEGIQKIDENTFNVMDNKGQIIRGFRTEQQAQNFIDKYATGGMSVNGQEVLTVSEWVGKHENTIMFGNNKFLTPDELAKHINSEVVQHEVGHVLASYIQNLVYPNKNSGETLSRWAKSVQLDGDTRRIFSNAKYIINTSQSGKLYQNTRLIQEDMAESFQKYLNNPRQFAKDFPARAEELKKAIGEFEANPNYRVTTEHNDFVGMPQTAKESLKLTKEEQIQKLDDLTWQVMNSDINASNYENFVKEFDKIDGLTENLGGNQAFETLFNSKHPNQTVFEEVEKTFVKAQKALTDEFKNTLKTQVSSEEYEQVVNALEYMRNDFIRMAQDEGITLTKDQAESYILHGKSNAINKTTDEQVQKVLGEWLPKQNQFAKDRTIEGTIREINEKFKKMFGIQENFFETDAAKLYIYRGLKSNELVFEKRFANKLFDMLGTKVTSLDEIPATQNVFAHTQDVVDLLAKQKYSSTEIEDVLKHFGLPENLLKANKPVVELKPDAFARLKGLNKDFQAFALHDATVDYINKIGKLQIEDGSNSLLKLYDSFLRLWKVNNTIVIPGFHMGNFVSNQFQNWLGVGAQIFNPVTQYEAAKILGSDKDFLTKSLVTNAGKEIPWSEVQKKMLQLDVINNTRFVEEAKALGKQRLNQFNITTQDLTKNTVNESIANPLQKMYNKINEKVSPLNPFNMNEQNGFIPYRVGYKMGNLVENQSRALHFIAQLKNGMDFREAAESVNKFLFDYDDLSEIERGLFKRIIPFYTWMRKNIPLQLEQITKQPGTYSTVAKAMNTIEKAVPADMKVPDKYRNAFAQDWVQLPFTVTGKSGTQEPLFLNPRLPISDLNKLSLKDILSSTSPLIKVPIELAMNQNIYFGSPINQGPGDSDIAPAYLQPLLNGTKDNPATITPEERYLLRQIGSIEGINKILEANNEREKGQIGNDRDLAALSYLVGFKGNSYDAEKFKKYALRSRLTQLKKLIKAE